MKQRLRSGLLTRLGKVPVMGLLALGVSAPLTGCSSEPLGGGGVERVGTLGVHLEAAPGVTLNSVTYTISGNGFSKTGAIDTSGSPAISGTIGGIPAGNGYTITLTAVSAEQGTSFTGSSTFNVSAGGATAVTIHLRGSGTTGNGSVSVNGTLNVGPVIDELTVTPLTVFVGSSITLRAVARDGDEGPSPLSYYWSSTGGIVDHAIEPSATLTSTHPGTFTLELTVSDGELTDTATTTVTFVEREENGSGGAGGGGGEPPTRPNILLIIADDFGAESTSFYPDLVGDSGASVLELAGIPVSHVNDSYSFKPVLSDDAATSGRTHSFTEISSGTANRSYAVKDRQYKLLSTNRRWELYDLVADPLETKNLYASAPHQAVRATLQAEIAALRAQAPAGYFPE